LGTDYQNGLSISVYYGDVTPSDQTTGNRVEASEFIINSGFDLNVGFANDIALIKLATPVVEQTGVVEYVKLATSDPPAGTTLQIQGYGQTFEGQNFTSSSVIQLKIGNVIVATANDCINYFNSITIPPSGQKLPPNFFQPSANICLRDGSVSTCHGDSGGSAVYKVNADDTRWTTVGLVSFSGNTCPGTFTGFTRVSQYYDWVLSNTNNAASTSAPDGSPSSSQSPATSSSPSNSPTSETPINFPTDPLDTFDPQTTLAPGVTTTRASGPTTRAPSTTRIFATTRGPTSGPVRGASASSLVTYNTLLIVAVMIAATL
jgi:secreted trypsin-like serine protease